MVELDQEILGKILHCLQQHPQSLTTAVAQTIGHNRITVGKYLDMLSLQKKVVWTQAGKGKLWSLATNRPTVLIVDDEPHILALLSMTLDCDYEVLSATTGSQAVELARSHKPALIVLDLMLPQISGFEVIKILKANSLTHSIPIIVLSAKTQAADRAQAMACGADDYMAKPFEPAELLARISARINGTYLRLGLPKDDFLRGLKNDTLMICEIRGLESYSKRHGQQKKDELLQLLARSITFVGATSFIFATDSFIIRNAPATFSSQMRLQIDGIYQLISDSREVQVLVRKISCERARELLNG